LKFEILQQVSLRQMTLQMGIGRALKKEVPEVKEIVTV